MVRKKKMNEQKEEKKENEVICQKVDFSGYELSKLVGHSQELIKFLKGLNCGVSVGKMQEVLRVLADFYNEKYNCVFVRQKYIAKVRDCSEKVVRDAFDSLIGSGLLFAEAMGKDKRRKVYYFTKKFFDIILVDAQKILPSKYPTRLPVIYENTTPEVRYPYTKTNNVVLLNNVKPDFQKKVSETDNKLPYGHSNVHITGRDYPKFTPKRQEKEEMSRGQALEFILNLPQKMQNFGIALQLRKKWQFSVEELKPPD